MMRYMTAVTQGDQIRRLITTACRAWKKVMNVNFVGIARLPAFNAPEPITSKDAFSSSAPILFACVRHDDLALVRIAGSQAALYNGNRLPWSDARSHLGWTSEPVRKKKVVGQGYGLATVWRTIETARAGFGKEAYDGSRPMA